MVENKPKVVQDLQNQAEERRRLMKKTILLLGVLQWTVESLEELMENRILSSIFVHELKRNAKGFIKRSDRIVNVLCSSDRDEKFMQELQNINEVVSDLLDGINWEVKDEG